MRGILLGCVAGFLLAVAHRGDAVARRCRVVADVRDGVAGTGGMAAPPAGVLAPLGVEIASIARVLMHVTVAALHEVAIARFLILVGSRLIAVRRGLIGVGGALVAVGQRLVGVRRRLLTVGERSVDVRRHYARRRLVLLSLDRSASRIHGTTTRRSVGHKGLHRTLTARLDESRWCPVDRVNVARAPTLGREPLQEVPEPPPGMP